MDSMNSIYIELENNHNEAHIKLGKNKNKVMWIMTILALHMVNFIADFIFISSFILADTYICIYTHIYIQVDNRLLRMNIGAKIYVDSRNCV